MTVYRFLTRFLALTTLLIPLSAESAGTIEVLDTIAGLPTEARIAASNPHTSYTGQLQGPGGSYTFSCATDGRGGASCALPGSRLTRAGTYTISLQPGGAGDTFQVLPDRIDPAVSSIIADSSPTGRTETRITVTLMDQYHNPLTGRPVELLSSDPSDRIQPLSEQTDSRGVQQFSLAGTTTGIRQVRAVDLLSNQTLDSAVEVHVQGAPWTNDPYEPTVQTKNDRPFYAQQTPSRAPRGGRVFYAQVASFDIIDHFEVTIPASMITGIEAQKIVIRAVDRQGNTVEDYVGTIVFSSTDPFAALPAFGEYAFRDRDLGAREFPLALKFQTPGEQTFRVEDKTNPDIFGEASVMISGSLSIPAERKIIITSHKQDQAINSIDIVLTGKAPPFINLMVTGGETDQVGETDQDGLFSIPLTLPRNQRDFTIRVRDENAQHDSGSLHLVLDTDGPPISTVSFSPERPEEGSSVLVIIESEPGLVSSIMTLTQTDGTVLDVNLSPTPSASGSYQAVFTAPAAGTYQPLITVTDRGGNSTELRTVLTVELAGLESITNIKATPLKNAVALEWDPCEDVDGYRIYVGENPDDFLYSLDTGRPTTKATVSGLLPGRTYYFAVTCVIGDTESETKSIVEATIPGLVLTVTSQDASLLLEWPALPTDIPLNSYLLEYGIEPATLTEQRNLHGSLQAFTIHDLLNDIPYYLRLTPISVTGDLLKDMAASGQGTPHALVPGFRPRPADTIPFSREGLPIGASVLPRAPYAHPTGLPTIAWVGIGGGILLLGLIMLRRHKAHQELLILAQLQQQYR